MTFKKLNLLARVNFPIYSVLSLTERHILIAGGGGAAKTGIANVIEIYELSNDGATCKAECVTRYETGDEAIMNCFVHHLKKYFILFAGKEGNCQIYKLEHDLQNAINLIRKSSQAKENSLRLRKSVSNVDGSLAQGEVHSTSAEINSDTDFTSRLGFKIEELEVFQTDFSDDPYQKLVKYSSKENILVTGGSDQYLRVWKYPNLEKLHDIEAHSSDITDLDISPLGKRIISVSKDGHAKVWDVETGELITELYHMVTSKNVKKYIIRNCRFCLENNTNLSIFATLNPVVLKPPSSNSFLCKWNANFSLQKVISTGSDMLCAIAVSDNGCYLGLGTQQGSVKIYSTLNLQKIYAANHIHKIFVTGLQFLPTCEESCRIAGGHEASLISISVDNHIHVHHIPSKEMFGLTTCITSLIFTLFLIFITMDFLQL